MSYIREENVYSVVLRREGVRVLRSVSQRRVCVCPGDIIPSVVDLVTPIQPHAVPRETLPPPTTVWGSDPELSHGPRDSPGPHMRPRTPGAGWACLRWRVEMVSSGLSAPRVPRNRHTWGPSLISPGLLGFPHPSPVALCSAPPHPQWSDWFPTKTP